MPQVTGQKVLPYPAKKIFNVVIDIETYPSVLNFIRSISILEKKKSFIKALVKVGFAPLDFSYDCDITYEEYSKIDIKSINGPFEYLEASWRFKEITNHETQVDYSLNSKFKSRFMEMTGGLIFAQQLHQSIDAFEATLRKS